MHPRSSYPSPKKQFAWKMQQQGQTLAPAPIYLDFVIELRSSSDTLTSLQDKMQKYMTNGALLGWLIDCKNRMVYVYCPNQEPEALDNPKIVNGDLELPEFGLRMVEIW